MSEYCMLFKNILLLPVYDVHATLWRSEVKFVELDLSMGSGDPTQACVPSFFTHWAILSPLNVLYRCTGQRRGDREHTLHLENLDGKRTWLISYFLLAQPFSSWKTFRVVERGLGEEAWYFWLLWLSQLCSRESLWWHGVGVGVSLDTVLVEELLGELLILPHPWRKLGIYW